MQKMLRCSFKTKTQSETEVNLKIYNLMGQEVLTLVREIQPAGAYSLRWSGTDYSGQRVSSGIYFYTLIAEDFRVTKKMLLLK